MHSEVGPLHRQPFDPDEVFFLSLFFFFFIKNLRLLQSVSYWEEIE